MKGQCIDIFFFSPWIMQGNASGGKHAENAGSHANGLIGSALAFIASKTVLPECTPSDS